MANTTKNYQPVRERERTVFSSSGQSYKMYDQTVALNEDPHKPWQAQGLPVDDPELKKAIAKAVDALENTGVTSAKHGDLRLCRTTAGTLGITGLNGLPVIELDFYREGLVEAKPQSMQPREQGGGVSR